MVASEAGAPEASSVQHFSLPLSTALNSSPVDEPQEWEYEYSETETETYYLTLDLTTPSIPCARPGVAQPGRGGYKPVWIIAGDRRHGRHMERMPTISLPKAGTTTPASTPVPTPATLAVVENQDEGTLGDNEDEEAQEQVQREPVPEPPQDSAMEETGNTNLPDPQAVRKPERVQILDLHTENPIITYKSHIFSCNWAENIGTELLFTSHDPARPLPVLRSLANGVDLLAASSARLISKSIKLVPKTQTLIEVNMEDTKHGIGDQGSLGPTTGGIAISIGKGASDSRRGQAEFLKRIVEIKQQKGEKDEVTIVAHKRLYPSGWRALEKDTRATLRADLQSIIANGGNDAPKAAKKLEDLDAEDKEMAEEGRQRGKNGILRKNKAGRKSKLLEGRGLVQKIEAFQRKPRGGRARLKLLQENASKSTPLLEQENNGRETLSKPTPRRWNELKDNGRGQNDEDMDDF